MKGVHLRFSCLVPDTRWITREYAARQSYSQGQSSLEKKKTLLRINASPNLTGIHAFEWEVGELDLQINLCKGRQSQ